MEEATVDVDRTIQKDDEDRKQNENVSFQLFGLKSEILRAVDEYGMITPSKVEREVISLILQGSDLICYAPSGYGKTTSYYLAILHQLIPTPGEVHVVILGHTRELVYHLEYNFRQFYRHIPGITSKAFIGGAPLRTDLEALKVEIPTIIVGTPGRIHDLSMNRDAIDLSHVKHLVLDECFWLLDNVEMKTFVQGIYDKLPIENKQVLLFTERDDLMTDRMLEVYKGFCRKPVTELRF